MIKKSPYDRIRAQKAEAELAQARKALEMIANPSTVAGMHDQDRGGRLQAIAIRALKGEPK